MSIIKKIRAIMQGKKFEKKAVEVFKNNPNLTDLQCYIKVMYEINSFEQSPSMDTLLLQVYDSQKKIYWVENHDGWIRKDRFFKNGPSQKVDLNNGLVYKNGISAKLLFIDDDESKVLDFLEANQ